LEGAPAGPRPAWLDLGVPEIHHHLSGPGLACGVLNEVAAAAHGDKPAALGCIFALTAAAMQSRPGSGFFIASRRALADFGKPYGHGLDQLGVDVGRLILVETRTHNDTLWALEETLRSDMSTAMVAAAVHDGLDLTSSRRLNLAAGRHAVPLIILRGSTAAGTSAAATRWRIAAAPAARDRFGDFAHWRWRVVLERARHGRPGEWLIEWNHVTHHFRLVAGVADRAPLASTGLRHAG
jgi:protein ImuA